MNWSHWRRVVSFSILPLLQLQSQRLSCSLCLKRQKSDFQPNMDGHSAWVSEISPLERQNASKCPSYPIIVHNTPYFSLLDFLLSSLALVFPNVSNFGQFGVRAKRSLQVSMAVSYVELLLGGFWSENLETCGNPEFPIWKPTKIHQVSMFQRLLCHVYLVFSCTVFSSYFMWSLGCMSFQYFPWMFMIYLTEKATLLGLSLIHSLDISYGIRRDFSRSALSQRPCYNDEKPRGEEAGRLPT